MAGRLLLLVIFLSVPCAAAWAQDPAGPEFQVNTYTTANQYRPAVASDATGNFVVVWESYGQDGHLSGIFGQRYNASGVVQGGEFRINAYYTANQLNPAVASDANGNFVVVWDSFAQDDSYGGFGVFGQRYNASGQPLGSEFQVNTYTTSDQRTSAVASAANGDFVVVWKSRYQDGSFEGIFGRLFTASGSTVRSEFQVNSYTTSSQSAPKVAAGGDGNFVVVWSSAGQDGSGSGIVGRRFDAFGMPLGGEFQVNSYTTGSQSYPAVASDSNGNFVVAWASVGSAGSDASGYSISAQRFDASGARVGGEFQANTFTVGAQRAPAVGMDRSGNFVIAWESAQDGHGLGVFGRRFNASGVAQGAEFQVNSYTTSQQNRPAIASAANGNFVVAWNSYYQDWSGSGVFARRYGDRIFEDGFE